jgi:hypothetical protein
MTATILHRLKPIKGSLTGFNTTAADTTGMTAQIDNQTILAIYGDAATSGVVRATTLHGVKAMDGGGTESLVVSTGNGTTGHHALSLVFGIKNRNWATGGNLAFTPASGTAITASYAAIRVLGAFSTGTRPKVLPNVVLANGLQNLIKDAVLAIPNDGKTLIFTLGGTGTPILNVTGTGTSIDSGRPGTLVIGNPGTRGIYGPFPTSVFGSTIYITNSSVAASTVPLAAVSLSLAARVTKPVSTP